MMGFGFRVYRVLGLVYIYIYIGCRVFRVYRVLGSGLKNLDKVTNMGIM